MTIFNACIPCYWAHKTWKGSHCWASGVEFLWLMASRLIPYLQVSENYDQMCKPELETKNSQDLVVLSFTLLSFWAKRSGFMYMMNFQILMSRCLEKLEEFFDERKEIKRRCCEVHDIRLSHQPCWRQNMGVVWRRQFWRLFFIWSKQLSYNLWYVYYTV